MLYWVGFIVSAVDCSVPSLTQGFSLPLPPLPFSLLSLLPFAQAPLASILLGCCSRASFCCQGECWAAAAAVPVLQCQPPECQCECAECSACCAFPRIHMCSRALIHTCTSLPLPSKPCCALESKGHWQGFCIRGKLCKSLCNYPFSFLSYGMMQRTLLSLCSLLPLLRPGWCLGPGSSTGSGSAALGRELGFCSSPSLWGIHLHHPSLPWQTE